jgi:hypothetical protein
MGTFNDRPFSERFAFMGDTAEQSVVDAHGGKVVRWGLDRPPFGLKGMPAEIRSAPDFLGRLAFYEACGVGRDQVVKIKLVKHEVQMWWDDLHPVIYHIFDPINKRWAEIEARVVQDLIDLGRVPLEAFASDGIEYYALDMALLMSHACDGGPIP